MPEKSVDEYDQEDDRRVAGQRSERKTRRLGTVVHIGLPQIYDKNGDK